MAYKSDNSISIKFILFLLATFIGVFFYVTAPDEMKNLKTDFTFEEMLEYNKPRHQITYEDEYEELEEELNTTNNIAYRNSKYTKSPQKPTLQPKEQLQQPKQIINASTQPSYSQTSATKGINLYDEKFDKLLDELAQYPAKNVASVETIVNKILMHKGYSAYTVKIVSDEREDLQSNTAGSYMAANFNIQTGCVHINKVALYGLKIEDIIAILAHELDHFDKIAQVCKSMGSENFIKLLNDNKMTNVNTEFWRRAPLKANITNFNAKYYQDALVRFLSQGTIDLASTYADLYRLSENMRNPLELSAYEVSDYVYDYYGIPVVEGPLRKLINQFNKVDWAIYDLIKNDKLLTDQRIALFDYFFMQAILDQNPKYNTIYQHCLSTNNGDMTKFWVAFETDNKSLYTKGSQIDQKTYTNIMSLLTRTEQKAKAGLTPSVVQNALKFKICTLLSNIVYPNAIKNIESAATDYIEYSKKSQITNEKDELKIILTLVCIENNLKKDGSTMPSVYYLKIPEVISKAYNITSEGKNLNFLYKNKAFIDELNVRKMNNPTLTEQALLIQLLNENRLFVKI